MSCSKYEGTSVDQLSVLEKNPADTEGCYKPSAGLRCPCACPVCGEHSKELCGGPSSPPSCGGGLCTLDLMGLWTLSVWWEISGELKDKEGMWGCIGIAAYPRSRSRGLCVWESRLHTAPCWCGVVSGEEGNDTGVSVQTEEVWGGQDWGGVM